MTYTEYDEIYDALVHMAKVKLIMNQHKGRIEDVDPDQLIDAAKQELDELHDAICTGSYVDVLEEVADVLNFAMAAGFQTIYQYRRR